MVGEKAAGGTAKPSPTSRPRGGRGGDRAPTSYSNKSRGFRGGGNVPARAVSHSETRSYTIADSDGDESDLDESTAYETTVEENSTNINVVRITRTQARLSTTSGHTNLW